MKDLFTSLAGRALGLYFNKAIFLIICFYSIPIIIAFYSDKILILLWQKEVYKLCLLYSLEDFLSCHRNSYCFCQQLITFVRYILELLNSEEPVQIQQHKFTACVIKTKKLASIKISNQQAEYYQMNTNLGTIIWETLLDHSDEKSCYFIMNDNVYDVTELSGLKSNYREFFIKNAGQINTEEQVKNYDDNFFSIIQQQSKVVGKIDKKPQSEYFKRKIRFLKAEFQEFSMQEIQKHNKMEDLWVVLDQFVYDFTEYQFIHPGRPESIHPYAGTDATEKFNSVSKHTDGARKFRENYKIGALKK